MIRLIASDMDGTLLNDKMQVSDENAAAIRHAQAQGVEFMVATGRGITEARPLLEAQDLHPAFITLNGAQVFNEAGEHVLTIAIPMAKANKIANVLRELSLYFEIVTSKGIYSASKVQRIENVAALLVNLNPETTYKMAVSLAAARLEIMNINYVDSFDELLNRDDIEILKIVAFSMEPSKKLADATVNIEKLGGLSVTSSSETNIEINDERAQKGIALSEYAKQQNIEMADVMAIGDNLNDLSMIEAAGASFAMGNAIDTVKKVAKYETVTNVESGVGKAIERALKFD